MLQHIWKTVRLFFNEEFEFRNVENRTEMLVIETFNKPQVYSETCWKIMQFDWFLSVLEQKRLENHEIYYIGAAE